jgi:BirA family biotin operon repressor/biotin-[acetyl-CoA-carboxylase] ligase
MERKLHELLPANHPWTNLIRVYDTLPSTNDLAKTLARQGAPQGTVILAKNQTQGRGRMGRSFHSPENCGIYMSLILRPNCPASELMHLTCAVAWAMCHAVEKATGLRPGIKWINDLVHQKRKLGGILTELGFDSQGKVSYAVIGIGLNCLQQQADFPPELQEIAASLSMFCEKPIDIAAVAAQVILSLEDMARKLLTEKETILARYRGDCVTLGQDVVILREDSRREAFALDIDDQGALILKFPDGHQEAVSAGEVSVRGMYGYL